MTIICCTFVFSYCIFRMQSLFDNQQTYGTVNTMMVFPENEFFMKKKPAWQTGEINPGTVFAIGVGDTLLDKQYGQWQVL